LMYKPTLDPSAQRNGTRGMAPPPTQLVGAPTTWLLSACLC
jgi:hypothetical protein